MITDEQIEIVLKAAYVGGSEVVDPFYVKAMKRAIKAYEASKWRSCNEPPDQWADVILLQDDDCEPIIGYLKQEKKGIFGISGERECLTLMEN